MRRMVAILASVVLLGGLTAAPAVAGPTRAHLSQAQRQAALKVMSVHERALRQEQFTSGRYDVLRYSRSVQAFDRKTGKPVGAPRSLAAGELSPSMDIEPNSSNAYLTLTVSVAFDRQAPPYRWDVTVYFDWTHDPGNYAGEDTIGLAWANNLALNNSYAYGYNGSGQQNTTFYVSDGVPNTGVGWSFNEYWGCTKCQKMLNYGYLLATIKETSLHGDDTNIVAKYFHTYQSLSYYLNIGKQPSITISPTSSQWSLAAFTDFVD
jgi:hypothetical protein